MMWHMSVHLTSMFHECLAHLFVAGFFVELYIESYVSGHSANVFKKAVLKNYQIMPGIS